MVKLIGFTKEGYHKVLASLNEDQVYMTSGNIREVGIGEFEVLTVDGSALVIDPKDFPEMDRFVVCVERRK